MHALWFISYKCNVLGELGSWPENWSWVDATSIQSLQQIGAKRKNLSDAFPSLLPPLPPFPSLPGEGEGLRNEQQKRVHKSKLLCDDAPPANSPQASREQPRPRHLSRYHRHRHLLFVVLDLHDSSSDGNGERTISWTPGSRSQLATHATPFFPRPTTKQADTQNRTDRAALARTASGIGGRGLARIAVASALIQTGRYVLSLIVCPPDIVAHSRASLAGGGGASDGTVHTLTCSSGSSSFAILPAGWLLVGLKDYLERTLWKIFEHHPANSGNQAGDKGRLVGSPIVVSQDGPNPAVQDVIETYQQLFEYKLGIPLYRIQHEREPNEVYQNGWDSEPWSEPYKRLAKHYGWAIEQVFSSNAYTAGSKHSRSDLSKTTPPKPHRLIILEEDIEVARDFFSLMNATADLLDVDDTLLAVSSFNDNGRSDLVADSKRLVRSDFFPGLGWMMSRSVWDGNADHPGLKDGEGWAPGGWVLHSSVLYGFSSDTDFVPPC